MASTAKFIYAQQSKKTLAGPYIFHARYPHCILEMAKAPDYIYSGHKGATFKIIKEIEFVSPQEKQRIEQQADEWFYSQISQQLLNP